METLRGKGNTLFNHWKFWQVIFIIFWGGRDQFLTRTPSSKFMFPSM